MSADEFPTCDDCTRPTDPSDTGPSCTGHVVCASCFETGDFRCGACGDVRADLADPSWLQILADVWRAGRRAS